jgi:MerR family mercuric resistance operon transcriptional regulator
MTLTTSLAIGDLSHRTGCNVETIRYYERIGLLPPPRRSASRYRRYDADDVRRLAFVRRARQLGFTLDEVRALLRLAGAGEGACADAQALAATHLKDVRAKIADLRAMQRVLASVIRECDAGEHAGCPLIDALSV